MVSLNRDDGKHAKRTSNDEAARCLSPSSSLCRCYSLFQRSLAMCVGTSVCARARVRRMRALLYTQEGRQVMAQRGKSDIADTQNATRADAHGDRHTRARRQSRARAHTIEDTYACAHVRVSGGGGGGQGRTQNKRDRECVSKGFTKRSKDHQIRAAITCGGARTGQMVEGGRYRTVDCDRQARSRDITDGKAQTMGQTA